MAISFQKLGLIFAVSALTVTGSIWFNRTSGNENRVMPQDVEHIMNMYQERCVLTRWGTNSTSYNPVYPNTYGVANAHYAYSISDATSDTYFYYIGTNKQFYVVPEAIDENKPYTNLYTCGNTDWYQQNPVTLLKSYVDQYGSLNGFDYVYDYSNRWILGVYDSFAVSGFATASFNGTYTNTGNRYSFANDNGITLTYNETNTIFADADGIWGENYQADFPPWLGSKFRDTSDVFRYPLLDDFYITCIRGNVSTNFSVEDRPCYKTYFTDDWTLRNRKPSYHEFLEPMDYGIFGSPSTYNFNGNNPWVMFVSSEDTSPLAYMGFWYGCPDGMYTAVQQFSGNSSQRIYWSDNNGAYIDSTKWGTDTVTNFYSFRLHPETWGLPIYYATNSANPTVSVPVVRFSSQIPTVITNYTVINGVNVTNIVNGYIGKDRIYKSDLQERYNALTNLGDTVILKRNGIVGGKPSNPVWVKISNNNRWKGTGWGTTPQLAFDDAIANATRYPYSGAGFNPFMQTILYRQSDTAYTVSFTVHDGKLITNMASNNDSQVYAYAISTNITASGVVTNIYDSSTCSVSFEKDVYKKFGYQGTGKRNYYEAEVTSSPKLPTVYPTENGKSTVCGFAVGDAFIMVKFDMVYN